MLAPAAWLGTQEVDVKVQHERQHIRMQAPKPKGESVLVPEALSGSPANKHKNVSKLPGLDFAYK
jgi:hypothetical protein